VVSFNNFAVLDSTAAFSTVGLAKVGFGSAIVSTDADNSSLSKRPVSINHTMEFLHRSQNRGMGIDNSQRMDEEVGFAGFWMQVGNDNVLQQFLACHNTVLK
jgi:hypothetical protein